MKKIKRIKGIRKNYENNQNKSATVLPKEHVSFSSSVLSRPSFRFRVRISSPSSNSNFESESEFELEHDSESESSILVVQIAPPLGSLSSSGTWFWSLFSVLKKDLENEAPESSF